MKAISKFMLCVGLAAAGLAPANAQGDITLVLKDGTELTGYISRQKPGEDITFTSAKALVNLPAGDVLYISDTDIPENQLSEEWKKWAVDNDAYRGTGNNRKLTLSDISLAKNGGTVRRVRVLGRGTQVRYLDLGEGSREVNWDSIAYIRADRRPRLMLSGIDRRYMLKNNNVYQGQYVYEVPGKTITLLDADGMEYMVNSYDIVQDDRIKVNPDQSIYEQSELVDIVKLNNGSRERGIITERRYYPENDTRNRSYLVMQRKDGSSPHIYLDEIDTYYKDRNQDYNAIVDIELEPNQVAFFDYVDMPGKVQELKEYDDFMSVDVDTAWVKLPQTNPQELTVRLRMDNVRASQLKLLPLANYSLAKNLSSYGFTYKDLATKVIAPESISTNVNGITSIEYLLPAGKVGYYGLYDPKTQNIWIFEIEGQKGIYRAAESVKKAAEETKKPAAAEKKAAPAKKSAEKEKPAKKNSGDKKKKSVAVG